jgi:ribosomal protein S18 acetylase RimI-like enzyme
MGGYRAACAAGRSETLMTAPAALHVRPLLPAEWPLYRDLRLRALADAPDAFGSTHAQEAARPDVTWAARLDAARLSGRDYPLVAEHAGEAVGLSWVKLDTEVPPAADLYQVWVAPSARGAGVGTALLAAATGWARAAGAVALRLSVTWNDGAAVRLYRRAGFVPDGPPAPLRPDSDLQSQPMVLVLAPEAAPGVATAVATPVAPM